jgi:hypothetical protein
MHKEYPEEKGREMVSNHFHSTRAAEEDIGPMHVKR